MAASKSSLEGARLRLEETVADLRSSLAAKEAQTRQQALELERLEEEMGR